MSTRTTHLPQADQERQSVLDNLADGYYEADLQGSLLTVNMSLARLLGCESSEQLTGNGYKRFIDSGQVRRLIKVAQRVLETGKAEPMLTCTVKRADGERRLFEVSMALVRDAAGEPRSFSGIIRDITERGANPLQAELDELRQRYDDVSELEQLKTHMIRITAHDLRSPLAIIASYIEMIDEELSPQYGEQVSQYINAIRLAVARIMQLTSDILTLERVNEYRDVTLMRVQLGNLLQRTLDEFAENSRQRHQQISLSVEPLAVYGDGVDLHEAIANLLSNAIKYTPDGGKVEARLTRDGDFAVLEIIDSGYGIPEDQQEHLFQPFQRIKTQETHMIEGTGLGLYLVKKIVERHGGSILFESEYGKGSRFGFRLPLAKPGE